MNTTLKDEFEKKLMPMLEEITTATDQHHYFEAVGKVFQLYVSRDSKYIVYLNQQYINMFRTARQSSPFYKEATKHDKM